MIPYLKDVRVDLFSAEWLDQVTLGIIEWIQQYGVNITIVLALLGLFGRLVAKMRKHTPAEKWSLNFAAGMGFITLVFIFLPYLFLYYRSSSAGEQMITGDWKSFIFSCIEVLQKASILVTIMAVLMSLTFRQLADIRKNPRLKQTYLGRAVGISLLCLLFQFVPGIVQTFMK